MKDNFERISVIKRYANKKRLMSYIPRTKGGLASEEELIVKRYIATTSSILVVGCGTGRGLYGLKKLGFTDLTGVDISPDMIKEAKKLIKGVRFYCSDINTFRNSKKFDAVIYFSNILEQIPSPEKRKAAMAKAKSLLKRGGIAIFTTHSRFIPGKVGSEWIKNIFFYILYLIKIKKMNPFEFVDDKHHIYAHFSNPFWVIRALEELGFEMIMVNSKQRIVRNLKPSIFWLFGEPVYYVVRTPE